MGKLATASIQCLKGHLLQVEQWGEECPYCSEIVRLIANGTEESIAEKIINISAYLDALTERLR